MGYRFVATVFCFAVMTFGAARATAQPLSFARDDYASATGARGIVSVDLNRDGWPDVALANTGRNSVVVLLNDKGTLKKTGEIPVGIGPFDITAADFNRDGKPDLAVTVADANAVVVLYGAGDGTFQNVQTLKFDATLSSPRGIRAADVNGDGYLDLVVTGYNSNSVGVLIGNGAGAFAVGPRFAGYAAAPQGLAIVDLNHDGRPDVVVAHESAGGLAVMYGDGSEDLFAAPTHVGTSQFLNVVAVGDFNRDGWIDVAAASTLNGNVSVFLGGTSGLTFKASYAVGASPRGLTVADVNDDGALDLLVANYGSSTVGVLLGDVAHPGAFKAEVEFASGSGSRAITAADFNNDARIDIVTGNQKAASTTELVNEMVAKPAAFSFTKSSTGGSSSSGGDHAEVADFNHDGKLDVATLAASGTSLLVHLTGGSAVSLATSSPYYIDSWMVGDVTGDGNADVVAVHGYPSTLISLFIGDGKGAFKRVETTNALTYNRGALGDMNGDGRLDLVFAGYDSSAGSYILGVYRANANGTFTLETKTLVGAFVADVALADVDYDGKLDVLEMSFPNGLGVFADYDPSSGFHSTVGYNVSLPNITSHMAIGDVNHDGFLDLVLSTDEQMALMLGGPYNFQDPTYFDQHTVGGNWHGPAIADINLDGNPDIITDQGAVLFGRGDGSFMSPQRFDFGPESEGVIVADMNRDGLPDLVVGGSWSQVTVLLNSRNQTNHPPTVSAGADRTASYQDQFGEDYLSVAATGSDPDAHALTYVWRDQSGKVVSNDQVLYIYPALPPGSYTFTVTASDGRGAAASDSMTLTITPVKEVVIWAADGYAQGSAWTQVSDATAAGGIRAYNPNKNAPKINSPSPNPSSYYAIGFIADPTQTYKLWVRLKADGNSPYNDSVWVQFTGSSYSLPVNLEECSGCGESGWGWEDDGWGSVNKNGITLRFPDGYYHEIWIQQREDGVSIDQIVLSSEKYLTTRPGAAKNDMTVLPRTYQPNPD